MTANSTVRTVRVDLADNLGHHEHQASGWYFDGGVLTLTAGGGVVASYPALNRVVGVSFVAPKPVAEAPNVSVEPPLPAFINGDVCRSKAFPGSVCVRSGGMWRWTDDPKRGWDDDRTAGHLASGYYVGIRIAGKAVQP